LSFLSFLFLFPKKIRIKPKRRTKSVTVDPDHHNSTTTYTTKGERRAMTLVKNDRILLLSCQKVFEKLDFFVLVAFPFLWETRKVTSFGRERSGWREKMGGKYLTY
jgi:hypothetical protein